jgi:peptide/nickel transport system substrate-binding protein
MRAWRTRSAVAVSCVALLLAACSSSTSPSPQKSASAPTRGGIVNVGIDSDPSTLDPSNEVTLGQIYVETSLFDSPLQVDVNGNIRPGLAESWHFVTPQKLVLNLRQGVTYTDGSPFNAETAKFGLDRQREKTATYAGLYSDVADITVTGPDQLTITLKSPDVSFLNVLAGRSAYLVSPAAVKQYGSKFGLHPVGTGPFMLDSYRPNSEVVLKRNPQYWQPGRPYLDGVVYHIITDDTTKTVAVVSGQLQTADYVQSVDADRAKGQPSVALSTWPGTLTPYIPINYHIPPLDDPSVREAISLAIDRQSIAQNVFLGNAQPANSMLPPSYPAYDSSLPTPVADVEKAKQLLHGRHLELTMQVPPTYKDLAQVLKQQLEAVGITLTLQNMDWGTLVNNFYKNNFQLQMEDNTGQWPNADLTWGGFFMPGGGFNGLNFEDPQITSALTSASAATSQSDVNSFYAKAQQAAYSDNIYVPVVWVSNLRASSTRLHGVPELPDGFMDFRNAWLG